MNNEINYEIDNCIINLDTLKALDKRAMKDLENNTHEIEQQEVLTIIREFIRLRNDYQKEKEKNRLLLANNNGYYDLKKYVKDNYISKDKIKVALGIEEDITDEQILDYIATIVSENNRLEDIEDKKVQIEYQNVFNKGVKSVEDKIKAKIEELENEIKGIIEKEKDVEDYQCEQYYKIQVLQELLEE